MYSYAIALALFVFPCLVEPGVVGVQAVGEYDSNAGSTPASMRGADPSPLGDPAAEDRPLSSSAAFG
jgi:hypothetical protein